MARGGKISVRGLTMIMKLTSSISVTDQVSRQLIHHLDVAGFEIRRKK